MRSDRQNLLVQMMMTPTEGRKRLMRVKGYDSLKIASIPKNAAECRGFQESSHFCHL